MQTRRIGAQGTRDPIADTLDLSPDSIRHNRVLYEDIVEQLTQEILVIESQLAQPNRMNPDGTRMASHAYWQWRANAIHAKNTKLIQKRKIKVALQGVRPPAVEYGPVHSKEELDGALQGTVRKLLFFLHEVPHYTVLDADYKELLEDLEDNLTELQERMAGA